MIRLGLLTTSFPRFDGDSAGGFVLEHAKVLVQLGCTVDVLAPRNGVGRAWTQPWPGISVRWLSYMWPRAMARTFFRAGAPDNLRRDVLAWPGAAAFPCVLWHAARRYGSGWQGVVSHWVLPCGMAASFVAHGRPHWAVVHGSDLHLLRQLPGRRRFVRRLVHQRARVQCVSQRQGETFAALLPKSPATEIWRKHCLFAAPMGVDGAPPDMSRDRTRRALGLHKFTALCLSRLIPIKGIDVAIRAFAGCRDRELVVAGRGPERSRLERLAVRCDAPVRFVGEVREPDKSRWLAAADALVVPSRATRFREEGAPRVVLEAYSAGLPVVASATGGISEMVSHERDGLLVPPDDARPDDARPDDAQRLRAAVDRLVRDLDLRLQLQSGARAAGQRNTWTAHMPRMRRWLDRFDTACSEH